HLDNEARIVDRLPVGDAVLGRGADLALHPADPPGHSRLHPAVSCIVLNLEDAHEQLGVVPDEHGDGSHRASISSSTVREARAFCASRSLASRRLWIISSIVPWTTGICTFTVPRWPMRCARSSAWWLIAGDQSRPRKSTSWQRVAFHP